MRRTIFLLVSALLIASLNRSAAQDPTAEAAARAAERQEMEERVKRLNTTVEGLLESQDLLRKKLSAMGDELVKLREENSRLTRDFVSRDEVKRILEELDAKREADRKLILDGLEELRKLIRTSPAPGTVAVTPDVKAPATAAGPEAYFEYTVQKDQFLEHIVRAYNEEFRKQGKPTITVEQVLKANPKLKPERMYVGQKIKIPAPETK
ncbi:MAG: LysM domain-containing protein, partial [Verrucomicrobiota bacterium]